VPDHPAADGPWPGRCCTSPPRGSCLGGHAVPLGADRGLNTLLCAGTGHPHDNGRITALGAGAMFRAAGILAKQHRLRRHSEPYAA
jgi:hypothetical protein